MSLFFSNNFKTHFKMKFYILLAFLGSFAVNVWGGNPSSCRSMTQCPNTWGIRMPTPTGSKAHFAARQSRTAAYLNLRNATPISITEQNMLSLMAVGRVEHQLSFLASGSISMNIGVTDLVNPQTWTLPAMALITTPYADVVHNYIAPASVLPPSAQDPAATHVRTTTFTNEESNAVTFYKNYKMVAGDELDELGTVFIENGTVYDYDEPAQIFVDAPLDLGDAFQTSVTAHEDEDPYPRTTAVCDVVVDGFGSITTPQGNTYQCLRLSLTRVQTFETDALTSTSETDYIVAWVTREGFRFYATKPTQNASGTTTLTKLDMSYFENATLEVELLTFEGKMSNNAVDLTWTTANEKNNAGFDIERSTDGQTFEKIGFVKGNGTTTAKQSYNFTDNTPLSILTYYRLRQVDFDGTSTTSNIISIPPKDNAKGIKIYPNPSAASQITLDFAADTEGVAVVNALGQVVFQQKTGGQNRLQLDISTWAKGLYFVKTTGNTEGVKFVKQ
jgi:Secretion system C-terminal sorting domain